MTKHAYSRGVLMCGRSHYVSIVEAQKDTEVYQSGDVDCPTCLRRMIEKHEKLVETFRSRLAAVEPHEATAWIRALCHECSEMVEIVDGKLAPHHGVSGEGCPENDAVVRIYLHPKVARRIAELEVMLVLSPEGER